ncbi:MAG: tetratricopeptide repeat protein [Thermoplasmatota archaeon]
MKCSFCPSEQVRDEEVPFCQDCWAALEGGEFPAIDFKDYFSEGLEQKLKDVDSLLFNIPENFFLWYLKGHLEHELGATKKALNSVKTSLSYKEDYGDPWIRLGLIFSDMHKDAEAIDHFKKGLKYPLLDPSNLVDAGVSLQASDQPKLASQLLQRALDLVPEDDRALVALGKVFVHLGDLNEARSVLQKGIELYPHNEEVLRGMAQILLKLEDLDSAMEMYSRILDQHPRDFEALLAKGEIHLRKKELSRSIKSYQAVKDLDIHISWTGILKFIVSNLTSIMESNENSLSYRDDLKKEYENIMLFLEKLDEKVHTTQGSEALSEIENLVKVLENMKLNLKDQVRQYEDLLEKFKVEDSFHQHLKMKVANLKVYLENNRFFDGKQIALELSPFLTDLRTRDAKTDTRTKQRMREKLGELKDIGRENKDIAIRFKMVEDLEKEGNLEGATFMLKEIEVSLEEYWLDETKRYHQEKMDEMKAMVAQAKDQFDTSGLNELLRTFMQTVEEGPRAITEAYQEFLEAYKKDSSAYYLKETERLVKEADLKVQLIEKDGANVDELRGDCDKLKGEVKKGKEPQELFTKANGLLKRIGYYEEQLQVSKLRFKLRNLDTLLGEVDFLGMDEELARNVEPVRKVIERSIHQENYQLSEILTKELYDNIEKILRDTYSDQMKELLKTTEGEVLRLKGLGVENTEWISSIENCGIILGGDPKGKMTEVINDLAKVQTDIQNFIMNKLPGEIDKKIEECRSLLEDGIEYGFPFSGEKRQMKNLEKASSEISSLDILEDSYKFERELNAKVSNLLEKKVSEIAGRIRDGLDELTNIGVEQQPVMDILSMTNRSEVLIETVEKREAWELINKAHTQLAELKERTYLDLIGKKMEEVEEMFNLAQRMDIDVRDLEKERAVIMMEKEPEPERDLRLATALQKKLMLAIKDSGRERFDAYREGYRELLKRAEGLLPEGIPNQMKEHLKRTDLALDSSDLEEIPELLEETGRLLDEAVEKAKEKSILNRCSDIIEEAMPIDDPKAKDIINKAQELSKRIRSGEMDGSEEALHDLQGSLASIRSVVHMQKIENVLTEVQELGDLAKDVLDFISDKRYEDRIHEMNDKISDLLDRTPALYKDPDPSLVDELSYDITNLNNQIIDLEQEWRARKRIDILEEMKLTKDSVSDKLLIEDISNIKRQFEAGDWNRFFRTWERIEGHIRKMEKSGILPGGSTKIIEEAPASPGIDILSRKKILKGKMSRPPPVKAEQREGGISKLAKDMAYKRQLIDDKKKDNGTKKTKGKASKSSDKLSDVARSIAGARIEKLKESHSKALEEDSPLLDGGAGTMIEDMLEIDTSIEKKEKVDAEQVREKLIAFFKRFPLMMQLEEVKVHFKKAEDLLKNGKKKEALFEYREAMTTAIKVGKIHMEMGKKLGTVRATLTKLKDSGYENWEAEDLYQEASTLFKEGDLLGCARAIKSIRDALAKTG